MNYETLNKIFVEWVLPNLTPFAIGFISGMVFWFLVVLHLRTAAEKELGVVKFARIKLESED